MTISHTLKSIQKAAKWSQVALAHRLGVSHVTLSGWIHDRVVPRTLARQRIERLYLDIVGSDELDMQALETARAQALQTQLSVKELIGDQKKLDKLALHLTYHTNTIEGSTMTLKDVNDVIFDHKVLSNRTAIEQTEARNHQATFNWLIDQMKSSGESFKFDEKLILDIHLRLMHGIISDAGQYRNHAVRIAGSRSVLVNHLKVPESMRALTRDMRADHHDLISQMARMHALFEQIHPFSDGNGRVGRLIMFAQALRAGHPPPLVIKERKYAYYKYLELAQTTGDHLPLELFIAESILFTSKLVE